MEMFYVDVDELDTNVTSEHKNLGHYILNEQPEVAVPYLAWTIATVVVGGLGNVLIIAAVLTEKASTDIFILKCFLLNLFALFFLFQSMRTRSNAFVVNLAISDFIMSAFVNPFTVVGK